VRHVVLHARPVPQTVPRRWHHSFCPDCSSQPAAVRKQLQNFLIRGCIYVVLGTAGLIVGSDKFDSVR
jgi:hypothetical protein